ncbi:hypothetical protein P6709_07655 [Jeotgalibacillus sp. ET6]|uniref:hypothetical protein n=1 Tax=Jeotgalibacillus sp. ET6 TaxID=3037260 RepID=UPI0024185BA7|nr:hypothetical protein [Jeotgalibacillus sp. ET6]MDG5471621.1 hypothetical protein [Jeotgalibacillus sp. ET6]
MGNEMEDFIIQNYQKEERMMILVFAQWCVNHDLDPKALYLEAYSDQAENPELNGAIDLTVSKDEAGEVPDDTVLGVLSMFGNDDLAFVVSQEMEKLKKKKK